jgi:putative phage-type endonuclease
MSLRNMLTPNKRRAIDILFRDLLTSIPQSLPDGTRNPVWLELREKATVNPSALGMILGLYKNKTMQDAVNKKVYKIQEPDNDAMEYGRDMEDHVISMYEKEKGVKVFHCGFIRSKEYPWLGGSPDGICIDNGKLIEVKCYLWGKIETCPKPAHFAQIQAYLEITGLSECDLLEYRWPTLKITTIKRDTKWWQAIMPALRRFLEAVEFENNLLNDEAWHSLSQTTVLSKPSEAQDLESPTSPDFLSINS